MFKVLNVEFFPRESHLITFRDPWSFPILFHPACTHLVRKHMEDLAQKVGACTGSAKIFANIFRLSASAFHWANIQSFATTDQTQLLTKRRSFAHTWLPSYRMSLISTQSSTKNSLPARRARAECCTSWTAQWTSLLLFYTNSLTKLWRMICCPSRKATRSLIVH